MKHQNALRRRRVYRLCQAAKANAAQSQFLDRLDELFHRPRQPGEFPDDESVTTAGVAKRFTEGRAIRDRAGHLLDIMFAPYLVEGVWLQGKILVERRDASIAKLQTRSVNGAGRKRLKNRPDSATISARYRLGSR